LMFSAPASYPSASGLTSMTKLVPDLRPAGSRAIVIAGAAVVTLGLLLLVVKVSGAVDTSDDQRVAVDEREAAMAVLPSPPPPVDATPPDAAVAAPAVAPVDAAVPEHLDPPPPPSIVDAVEAKEWATALKLCSSRKIKTLGERTSCGIAACNAGQRAVALVY